MINENSSSDLKKISLLFNEDGINPYNFIIPSYQRGYRWDECQIRELLNDILTFNIENNDIKQIDNNAEYCLQPVVVQKDDEGKYELIDGQQRLTTLYLIAVYMKNKFADDCDWLEYYSLEYEEREDTQKFLLELRNNFDCESNNDIDSYYISNACKTIKAWFEELKAEKGSGYSTYKNHFIINFSEKVNIIWYETKEENPIAVFRRLNIGKIELEDSELIKALFLKKSENITEKKQFRIASEWDAIEKDLQNDSFWYFLNLNDNKKNNRIDLIFDIIRENDKSEECKKYKEGKHKTFRYFYEKLLKNNPDTEEIWEDNIMPIYYTLKGWFNNRVLYHLIGFTINANIKKIHDLYFIYKNQKTNEDFIKELKKEIYNYCLTVKNGKNNKIEIKIDDIVYDSNNRENCQYLDKIKNILLLHNILTVIKNKESEYRFPFDKYNGGKGWDIEHISPSNMTEVLPNGKKRIEWYKEYKDDEKGNYIDKVTDTTFKDNVKEWDEIIKNNSDLTKEQSEKFDKEIYQPLLKYYNKLSENKDDKLSDNEGDKLQCGIGNLALLNADINRSYGNDIFPKKRSKIIEADKCTKFIPLCTKNAFLGYYLKNQTLEENSDIYIWADDNAKKYREDIENTISEFFDGKTDNIKIERCQGE